MSKKNQKINSVKKTKKTKKRLSILNFGSIHPDRGRILVLIVIINLLLTGIILTQMLFDNKKTVMVQTPVLVAHKDTQFEQNVKSLVQGYPIEQMTPYILKQDPKVAAFLIAIAKKESAWGKRHPVLAGRDCYNYWGFRLKTDSMGSGGHTCFDSPEEAVNVVASRLDELVNKENIDSPKEMIVWKCGYGCQDSNKTVDEKKWITDVNLYYGKVSNYL